MLTAGLADRIGDSTEFCLIVFIRRLLRPFCEAGVFFSYEPERDAAVACVRFGLNDVPAYFHGIATSTLRQIAWSTAGERDVHLTVLVDEIYQGALEHLDRATAPTAA